ncbi:MAG: hypothetical protein GDA46_07420 [Bdellovibrionales bacterium]|nr:hypothetical protein [Bdellovibrionales bacterium]
MNYFTKLSKDERMQELAYDEYRRKIDYRLDKQDWEEKGRKKGRKEGMQEGIQRGIEKGRKQGIEEGRQAEKREQAFKLLKLGIDISTIIKVTSLSKSKILKLKKK